MLISICQKNVDQALSWVFITPLMHKVHHHYQQPLTDTNYGNIFSFWDRIFSTFAQVEDTKELIYGVDTHMNVAENDRMSNLLKIPFQPYRQPEGKKLRLPILIKTSELELPLFLNGVVRSIIQFA